MGKSRACLAIASLLQVSTCESGSLRRWEERNGHIKGLNYYFSRLPLKIIPSRLMAFLKLSFLFQSQLRTPKPKDMIASMPIKLASRFTESSTRVEAVVSPRLGKEPIKRSHLEVEDRCLYLCGSGRNAGYR